jgi:hypothetical protein
MTNKNKVIFYIIYLYRLVYNWFKPILTNFLENDLRDHKTTMIKTFNNYITFKSNLKKMYKDINKEHIVERQL